MLDDEELEEDEVDMDYVNYEAFDDCKNMAHALYKEVLYALSLEFQESHLSGNLMNNIAIFEDKENGNYAIGVEAPVYDVYKYINDGVINHIPQKGDYSSKIDIQGSMFGKRHKNYINKAVDVSIKNALHFNGFDADVRG